MKKKHTILIVPPRGVPLKSFKIRLTVAIVFLVISFIGFAGFFVPIKTITNNVAEQNQQKNLTEQNRALLQKVLSSLRMLQNVRNQISKLEVKKKQVLSVSGKKQQKADTLEKRIDYRSMSTNEIMSKINRIAANFTPFKSVLSDSGNIFDTIPILYPVAVNAHLSRRFGPAWDPFSGKQRFHFGIDFIELSGYPVYATASGIVKKVEKHPLWGNKVTIVHCGTYTTVYAHLGTVKVSQGKYVRRGTVIGEIGLSGLSSGPHIHYEIWRNGNQVDPEKFLYPVELLALK